MNRKKFIRQSILAAGASILAPTILQAASQTKNEVFTVEEITEFVFAAHKDLEATKKIIDAKPLILNCTSQIAKGDFETAVGGASHMGRKDIADLLVERGARLDIFNLAFLGHIDFVKQMIELSPQYLMAPGPHGFTLLHHAKVGKHDAFADWLREKGLDEERFKGVFKK